MQIWAGVALRGLYADGAFYAWALDARHAFAVWEPARWTSQILTQAPVVLAMRLGLDHPHDVALAYSLTTNLMPYLLTLACIGVLPRAERAFGLFPVLVFLAASMSAAVASVADGPTAAAYAWLLFLLILFGPLTRLRLAAILLLALGALRLHEEMAFLGPILVFACLSRRGAAEGRVRRAILLLAALLIATGCAVAIHDVLHPRKMANRTGMITDVVSLHWLCAGGHAVSVMALSGVLAILTVPAVMMLRGRGLTVAMGTLTLVSATLALLALTEPALPSAAFAARDNACLLTAPAMVVLLMIRRRPPPLAPAAFATAVLGLVIATADGAATAGWLGYTGAMRSALVSARGVLSWQDALARLPLAQGEALQRFSWPWTAPLMSLWLAPGPQVEAIIANPGPAAWQPFDPSVMMRALGAADAPEGPDQGHPPARDVRWEMSQNLGWLSTHREAWWVETIGD